jgi:hypothetical protein
MIVTIPTKSNHMGNPNNRVSLRIPNTCPICGGKRGIPYKDYSFDGNRSIEVDRWINPCGHIDTYASIRNQFYHQLKATV